MCNNINDDLCTKSITSFDPRSVSYGVRHKCGLHKTFQWDFRIIVHVGNFILQFLELADRDSALLVFFKSII